MQSDAKSNMMVPEETEALRQFYADFKTEHLNPLWTQIDDIMPVVPNPKAVPHVWKWSRLYPMAKRSGDLVPVGRGGERRAIGLANPGPGGKAYVTPTLWAAIQYLGPRETAPEHRHSQNVFRFMVEGEGVWTVVNGDPVRMSRGDFLVTPGWHFHGHHNDTDQPMAWIDGLANTVSSPIGAYRWDYTDCALTEQLFLEEEGQPATVEQGHAAVRYVNPTTGGDVMPTIRAEFHRLRAGVQTPGRREVGSPVFQVFDGKGAVVLNGTGHRLEKGDMFVVPSLGQMVLAGGDTVRLLPLLRRADHRAAELCPHPGG